MPVVILKKENICNTYNIGEHILGRGKELECSSKKVSRKHGILKVSEQGVYLESTHNNPCFHKPNKISNVKIVSFGNNVELSANDQIALCLDHGWFTVQFQQNDVEDTSYENALTQPITTNNLLNETSSSTDTLKCPLYDEASSTALTQPLKRPMEDDTEPQIKKQKSDDTVQIKVEPDDPVSNNVETTETIVKEEIKSEDDVKTEDDIKQENDIKQEIKTEDVSGDQEVNDDTNNNKTDDGNPSTSGTNKRPWRDRCWYGIECYRKNSNHRVEFTHPGDSDYDSDPNDSRPICCYGADCYRKNKDHRKRYRHPGQKKVGKRPPPAPPKRRVKKKPVDPLSQDSEELDDYDYSDPFIDDGSEDEYEPSQETDTESEYEESQEVDEDNKRLLKEARKFTRNK